MNTQKIYDENGAGFTRVFTQEKVERVNPFEFFPSYEIEKRAILDRDLLHAKSPYLTAMLSDEFFITNAKKNLGDFFEKLERTGIPEQLKEVLQSNRKKDQKKLLKGVSLTPDQLMSLIFTAYRDFDYLYSRYIFEHLPTGYEDKKLPKLHKVNNDGTVDKVGKTDLTDGQLKQIIENRKVIVSNFFEKDDQWHCFFVTYRSLDQKENWKGGQPHFHYISSAFGISKEDFIESMRTGKYRSTSVHINLEDYNDLPQTEER